LVVALVLGALSLTTASAYATSIPLTNGDFETGTLAGWTTVDTVNGNLGFAPLPNVASFNTTGSGASDAAHFEVGEDTFTGVQAGGGIYQSFFAGDGTLTLTADIAAFSTIGNLEGGVFSLLLDGTPLDTISLELINGNQTLRGILTGTTTVAAGTHTVEILVTRRFINLSGQTPFEYVDNVTVDEQASAVPEPTSLVLLGTGLIGAGVRRYRRRAH
jgi:hypothetical protein